MKEDFLHYIWQHKLFSVHDLKTTDGEQIEIIDVGKKNTNAGPDFFNAKIKIGDKLWAGNVEIHLQSSDWKLHGHETNNDYQSIILHVVKQADKDIFRTSGEKIPQLELKYSAQIEENYEQLLTKKDTLPCANKLNQVPDIFILSWMNTLLTERLLRKTETIANLLDQNKNNWEEAFYIILARNFGFGINGEPFERLAKSLPLIYLQKHKNNITQIEALLFGQAGLLPTKGEEDYSKKLIAEYDFLRAKFELTPLDNAGWKLLRLRPSNFPHIRIAQFASLIHQSSKLFSKIIERPDYDYITSLFSVQLSDYWDTHYTFKKESTKQSKQLGKNAINTLLINTVVPFLFYYGKSNEDIDLQEKAISLLEKIPPEKNSIISEWECFGVKLKNSFDTQAMIELKTNYCDKKDCLRCRIGHKILTLQE
jgi:hypothetical protein